MWFLDDFGLMLMITRVFEYIFGGFDSFLDLEFIDYCCCCDAETHGVRFGFGSSSFELAETLDVSGGTHMSCGEL